MDAATLRTHAQTLADNVARLEGRREAAWLRVEDLTAQVHAGLQEVQILTLTGTALDTLLKLVSRESLDAVERLLTYGLQTVFPDQNLSFTMTLTTKFKLPWMIPQLHDGEVEAPILDAFGGGPASLVAFLLRLLVVRRLGLAPVILLDEPFSMVSEEYQETLARLLRELSEQLGVTFVLVTHDRAVYGAHAHHFYELVAGQNGCVVKGIK